MKISHKLITLSFVFTVLGSTLASRKTDDAFWRWLSFIQETNVSLSCSDTKLCDATRDAHCCLPNSTNDDWPAGMILGCEDFRLTLA